MTQGAGVRAEIEALNVEFWYRVDHENGEGVAELFSEDGVYSVARGRNAGRAAIARVLRAAAARGPRVSRHVHSNLRLTVESPTGARGVSMLTLWADDGEAPLAIEMPSRSRTSGTSTVRRATATGGSATGTSPPAFLGDEPAVLPFTPNPVPASVLDHDKSREADDLHTRTIPDRSWPR